MSESNNITIEQASHTIPRKRSSSIGADNQQTTQFCSGYTVTRLITRLITQMLPHYFELTKVESDMLYSGDIAYRNCFIQDSTNILEIQHTLKKDTKCIIDKRYNYLTVYYFTLYTILKKYGCPMNPFMAMVDFCNNIPMFYTTENHYEITISDDIDSNALVIITEFVRFINSNEIKISIGADAFDYPQDDTTNWINNFPKNAKKALDKKMYLGLSFGLDYIQWISLSPKHIYRESSKTIRRKCIKPIQRHSLTITNWEPGYVTLLNSWGTTWGNEGFIKVPSKYYYKFILNKACIPSPITDSIEKSKYFTWVYYFKVTGWEPLPSASSEENALVEECTATSCNIYGGRVKRKNKSKTMKHKRKRHVSRRQKK